MAEANILTPPHLFNGEESEKCGSNVDILPSQTFRTDAAENPAPNASEKALETEKLTSQEREQCTDVSFIDFQPIDDVLDGNDGILEILMPTKKQESSPNKRKQSEYEVADVSKKQKVCVIEDEKVPFGNVVVDLDVKETDQTHHYKIPEQQRDVNIDQILNSFSCLEDEIDEAPSGTDTKCIPDTHTVALKKSETDIIHTAENPRKLCLNPEVLEAKEGGDHGRKAVYVHKDLARRLKPHQVKGARFLWSHIAAEPEGTGCILADFMGLGKTLQVITVIQALLSHQKKAKDGVKRKNERYNNMLDYTDTKSNSESGHRHALILAPTICVRNWEAELVRWLGRKEVRRIGLTTLESSREKKMEDRIDLVRKWHQRGGILIMGYEIFRILILQGIGQEPIRSKKNPLSRKMIQSSVKFLCDPGPDLIVLDEGHRVRDPKSKLVQALSQVKTKRRVILTGYPLQNHLVEYWTMVNFARPNYLGSLDEFKTRFVQPIQNGQCVDSSAADVRLARQRAFLLTQDLKPLVLRRDQQYLFTQLPPKKEWVLIFKLSEIQSRLYRRFLECGVPKRSTEDLGTGAKVDILGGYHISLAISNHPDVLQEAFRVLENALYTGIAKNRRRKEIDDTLDLDIVDEEEDVLLGYETSESREKNRWRMVSSESVSPVNDGNGFDAYGHSRENKHRLSFAAPVFKDYEHGELDFSGKMVVLFEMLEACQEIGDRVIVFSQSIATLNVIEMFIAQRNNRLRRSRKKHDKAPFTSLRIDGSTSQQDRFRQIEQFNDPEEDVDVIFISTKAGGEGINLCGGNRIVIFDVCWNPCNDAQSMCRSYRFGQTKPVFVYRFVAGATMEKKVYDLQIRKEGVAKQIVDDKALERKFKQGDLQKYFDLDHFEEALAAEEGQVATVIASSAEEEEVKAKGVHVSNAGQGLTKLDKMLMAPQEDIVLDRVLRKMSLILSVLEAYQGEAEEDDDGREEPVADWIVDWFEQETMFEEDLDQQCSPKEQEEIMETHKYNKAVRRYKRSIIGKAPGGRQPALVPTQNIKLARCGHCNTMTELYPESITKVKTPRVIDCTYCNRSISTSTAINPVAATQQLMYGNTSMLPGQFGLAYPMQAGQLHGSVDSINSQQARMLPPHLYRLYLQQQMQQVQTALDTRSMQSGSHIPTQPLQQKQSSIMQSGTSGNSNAKLSERHLLILRRGVRGCQELKKLAEACGATIAIEINSQLTDIISGMNLVETLKWLKLTKLPRDVEFHSDEWLREKIEKERGNSEGVKGGNVEEKEGVNVVEVKSMGASVEKKSVDDSGKDEGMNETDRRHVNDAASACIVVD
uniref:Transcriptional regulator ATRX putative n=1 Tax=Albugo laibachii Nc14 TaxID=890382 RepID=F0WI30_9STRA|nr:transcriptional regulator ATRX putative [Albugo laibachii Nc14]|eukprot:CCA20908.1 transcriptional regulator ATRX putative [Albugo laibachii Nc14]